MSFFINFRKHSFNAKTEYKGTDYMSKENLNREFSKGYVAGYENIVNSTVPLRFKKKAIAHHKKNARNNDPISSRYSKGYLLSLKEYSAGTIVAEDKKWLNNEKWGDDTPINRRIKSKSNSLRKRK